MVTFNENIPYSEAMNKGRRQDELLLEYCKNVSNVEEINLKEVKEFVRKNI